MSAFRSRMRPPIRNADAISFSASIWPVRTTACPSSLFSAMIVRTGRGGGASALVSQLQAVKPKIKGTKKGAKKRRPPREKLVVSKGLSFERERESTPGSDNLCFILY